MTAPTRPTPPTAPILVTGGTGTLGRLVVPRLLVAGCAVRVLSRTPDDPVGAEHVTADLSTGRGVAAAVRGVKVIVHCAGGPRGDADMARQLVAAASGSGVRHLVLISVIGADRVPVRSRVDRAMFGYFAEKLAAERVVTGSGIPWTTLRASQFHDLMLTAVSGLARLPVVPVPSGFRFQPVDADEVATRLVELTLGAPAGLVPEIAGPQVRELGDLLRAYLSARAARRLTVPMPVPGGAAAAIRAGANLAPDRAVGLRTWEQFLTDRC